MLNIADLQRVALLIDADNIQLNHLQQILKISDHYGTRTICCAYGDWKKFPLSVSYQNVLNFKVDIVQVDRIAKDTSDKQLLIEAGEILGSGDADIFIIASGDGDFRLLCERIKQKGKIVVGIGNKAQTSTYLQKSCTNFHYIEQLEKLLIRFEQTQKMSWTIQLETAERIDLLLEAYTQVKRTDGLAHIGQIGQILRKLDSSFESHFSQKKLSEWLDEYSHIFKRNGNYILQIK